MRRRLPVLVCGLVLAGLLLVPRPAEAHVLLRDSTGRVGAVLHISPDDDPVAGQPAELFFDIQDSNVARQGFRAELRITDAAGASTGLPVAVSGSTVSSGYTFPVQGVYAIQLKVTSNTSGYTFNYSQRVARGTAASALDRPEHVWAETVLLAGGCLFLVLLVVAFNRRRAILAMARAGR